MKAEVVAAKMVQGMRGGDCCDVVFVSGSRSVRTVPARESGMERMALQGDVILVGDAPGADVLVQGVLHDLGCRKVLVFCRAYDGAPRNNVGEWETVAVGSARRRGSYTEKDVLMTKLCQKGLAFWDGRSRGTLANIERLVEAGKTCGVIVSGRLSTDVVSVEGLLELRRTVADADLFGGGSARSAKYNRRARGHDVL